VVTDNRRPLPSVLTVALSPLVPGRTNSISVQYNSVVPENAIGERGQGGGGEQTKRRRES
jgi:hypothetical protein